jgi:hypothetical protein
MRGASFRMYRGYRMEGKSRQADEWKLRVISVRRDHDAQNWLVNWRQSFGENGDRSEACDA